MPVALVVVVADDVDQLPAAQRVEHDRAVRPQPLPVVGRQRRAADDERTRRPLHRPRARNRRFALVGRIPIYRWSP